MIKLYGEPIRVKKVLNRIL